MTPEQMRLIETCEIPGPPIPSAEGDDRTLIYGYDTDRRTHHVYLKDGQVHQVIYSPSGSNADKDIFHYAVGDEIDIKTVIPNKRLYPEACDFDYCMALKELGVQMSFTAHGTLPRMDERSPYVGHVFDDGTTPNPH